MEKVHSVKAQGVGQTTDVVDAEVAFSPLDTADVGVVQSTEVGEVFLSPPFRQAE